MGCCKRFPTVQLLKHFAKCRFTVTKIERTTDIIRKDPLLIEIALTTTANLHVEVWMRPMFFKSRQECKRRSTERTNSRGNPARMVHGWTPSNTSMETFNCQRNSYGTCQTDANNNNKMKELKKYFKKLATKLMLDTKKVCCGETQLKSR